MEDPFTSLTGDELAADEEDAINDADELSAEKHAILTEYLEDIEQKREILLKLEAVEDILKATDKDKQQRIQYWAKKLKKHPRTITRLLAKVQKEGLVAFAKKVRSDAGQIKGSELWKPDVQYWIDFIVKTYKQGNRCGRRINRYQVYLQVKAHATLKLGLIEGEYPSHPFVYKVIETRIKRKKKARHPGQGLHQVIKTTEGDLVIEHSNHIWQCDHTILDILLVDEEGNILGCPYLTVIIDSYSGCVVGFFLGFEQPGSYEVTLALRHAILPKRYGAEYELKEKWETQGLPEYFLTDHAREFIYGHMRQVAGELGFQLRQRLYPAQGGLVESVFDKKNKEVYSLLPGYKGSNVQKRPKNAEKWACVTYTELERKLVRYFVDHYNYHHYPKVKNQTRQQRWQSGLPEEPGLLDERKLDICLMKSIARTVQRFGTIEFECLIYQAQCLKEYEREKVIIRYDPANIVTVLVYTSEREGQPSLFLGIAKAREIIEERLSLKEWREEKKKIRQQGKEIDPTSLLSERMDMNEFALKKVKTLKARRKTEQQRINCQFYQPKVVAIRPDIVLPQQVGQDETIVTSVSQSAPNEIDFVDEPTNLALSLNSLSQVVIGDWNEYLEDNW